MFVLETDYPSVLNEKCEYPEHELFMFNVLLQRIDMAEIFWREGRVISNVKLIIGCNYYKYINP